jgi:hypothetical protein
MLRSLALLLALAASLPGQESVRLLATLVDEQGAPLVGARVRLFTEAGWKGPGTAASDERGRIGCTFTPPAGQLLLLEISPTDRPHGTWAFETGTLAGELNLGRLVLPLPGVLVGRVVDEAGDTLPGEWKVIVKVFGPGNAGLQLTPLTGAVDPSTGEFRFENVPAGEVRVRAMHATLRLPSAELRTRVSGASETFAQLIYRGSNPRRTLALSLVLAHAPHDMRPVDLTIVAADDSQVTEEIHLRRGKGRIVAGDLGPGPYRLRVRDPRFETVDRGGIKSGTDTQLRLSGRGNLLLAVVDQESGTPVRVYGLSRVEPRWLPVPILPKGARNAVVQQVMGLLEGQHDFELYLPGRLPMPFSATASTGEEPTVFTLEVPSARRLEVLVTDAAGRPLTSVPVQLTAGETAGARHSGIHTNGQAVPTVDLEQNTGPDGRTVFNELFPTRHTLRVLVDTYIVLDRQVTPSADMLLTLRAPPTGELLVSLRLPPGLGVAQVPGDLRLDLTPEGLTTNQKFVLGVPNLPFVQNVLGPIKLPQGRVRLTAIVGLTHPGGQRNTGWILDSVNIAAGETTNYEANLRKTCPAHLRLSLTVDGAAWKGARLERHSLDVAGRWNLQIVGPDERVHDFLLPPGLHRFDLAGQDGTWLHRADLRLAPGEQREWTVAIQRIARPVRVIDGATGAPLVEVKLPGTLRAKGQRSSLVLGTDSLGRTSLALSEGLFTLEAKGYRPWELDWDGDLPELVEIALIPER